MTIELDPERREQLRQTLALATCKHDVDVPGSAPCSFCLVDAITPLIVGWLLAAHQAGEDLTAGTLRLYSAMLHQTNEAARRYQAAWQSARHRARKLSAADDDPIHVRAPTPRELAAAVGQVGMCDRCKAGDHTTHYPQYGGRCLGCICPEVIA